MTRAPRAPVKRGPINQSRGAGAAAPGSAAATAPMYAPQGFEPRPPAAAAPEIPVERHRSPLEGMGQHIDVGQDMTADPGFMPQYVGLTDEEILAAEIRRIKAHRQPASAFAQKLFYPPIPGYKLHWFSDAPGRVLQASLNGWVHVMEKGVPVDRHVGTGRDNQGVQGYLMKLPEVIWQEDMNLRNKVAEEKVAALKAGPFKAPPGHAQKSDAGKFYSPTESEPLSIVKGD